MPKATKAQSLARQWELLKLLPRKGSGISTSLIKSKLALEGFEVSKRTVERDLVELSLHFGIVCNDKSKPFGWRWMDKAGLDIPTLDVADAVSLLLVEKHLREMIPEAILDSLEPKFLQAIELLENKKGRHKYARWNEKIEYQAPALTMLTPNINLTVITSIQDALVKELQISVSHDDKNNLILHPLGILQSGQVTYLVATAYNYTDPRMYAVHRINSVEILKSPINKPLNFNLRSFVDSGAATFGYTQKINLELSVHSDKIRYLIESPLSQDMEIKASSKSDRFIVTASVNDSWQLRWWILSRGASVTVLAPEYLKQEITKELASAIQEYK